MAEYLILIYEDENGYATASPDVFQEVMEAHNRFAQQVGMLPLTGTTDVGHMREDLASSSFVLTQDEVGVIESIAGR